MVRETADNPQLMAIPPVAHIKDRCLQEIFQNLPRTEVEPALETLRRCDTDLPKEAAESLRLLWNASVR